MAPSPGLCSTVCSKMRRSTSHGSAPPAPAPSMPWRWLPDWWRTVAGARAKLRAVWEAVAKAGVSDLLRLNPWLASISRSNTLAQVASLFSPYDFNPLGLDPFRKLLQAHIDFAALRASRGPELLIAATDVTTGRPRLFRRHEISVEAVLASACLPTIHHAVSIGGQAYGTAAFPPTDLVTLGRESPVRTPDRQLTTLDRTACR